MKPAIYKGVTYNVPLWARWLAEDFDGELYAYEERPEQRRAEWYVDNAMCKLIARLPVQQPLEVE